jgi:hypothetical protein
MTAGIHPVDFPTFFASTSQALLSGPKALVNAAQKNNYATISRMWRGTDMAKILRGGSSIQERILNSVVRRSTSYLPGQPLQYGQTNPGLQLDYGWRFHMHPLSWQDELLVLQGASDMNSDARFAVWKRVMDQLLAEFWTEISNYYEELLWGKPTLAMEGLSGLDMGSIPKFVNEHTNGLFVDNSVSMLTNGLQSPATVENWRVQRFAYSNFTAGLATNWISAIRKCKRLIQYKASPIHGEFGTPVNFGDSDVTIFASEWGARCVEMLYQASQSQWTNQSDPWGNVYFDGIPLTYVAQKDSAAIYPGNATPANAAAVTEANAVVAGPRFEVVNSAHLFLVMHKDRVLHDLGVKSDLRTPTTMAQPFNTYAQLVGNNLRSCASIYPTTAITTPAA